MKLATLCYIKQNDQTLMLHRINKKNDIHAGKWNGVGGKFEEGETPEDCVIREVKEETGLNIKNPQLVGRILFPAFGIQPEDWHVYIFIAIEFAGNLIKSPEGDLQWIDNDKLLDLPLWPGDRLFHSWIKKQEFFSAKISYLQGNIDSYEVVFYKFKQ